MHRYDTQTTLASTADRVERQGHGTARSPGRVITLQPRTLLAGGQRLTEVIGHGEQVSLCTPAQEIRRYDRQPGPPERLSLPRQNGQLCVPGRPDLPARALVCSRDTGPCDGGRALMSGYLRSCMVVGMRMLRAPRFQGRGTAGPQR